MRCQRSEELRGVRMKSGRKLGSPERKQIRIAGDIKAALRDVSWSGEISVRVVEGCRRRRGEASE